ncbi:hypothetical protein KK137_06655 [Croceibacterium sp. LX-88]|uniref:LuxR family transcriptional regulator n=1 Tax=Croceibacterium selenioxidans TaxID=2838833 RepID=A0ABS5W475_9SPHN|nr:hypothetical protein [Croceibacterium selenioxidans]MBT2134010.1 hypothetical protein [Croceibacterium selenioxidans]
MKRVWLTGALAAGLLQASPATAQDVAPILGTWAVDVTKLPVPPDARPKSVMITFSDVGDGKYRSNVDIILADGSESHGVAIYPLDGSAAPATGSNEADTVAVRTPEPNVLVMALSKGGVPGSIRIYTVAPDGNSQTETAVHYNENGIPVMRTNYFTRVR